MKPAEIERIRVRAYEIYQDGGRGMQSALEDWLQAEWECSAAFDTGERMVAYQVEGPLPHPTQERSYSKKREGNGHTLHRPGTGVSDRE